MASTRYAEQEKLVVPTTTSSTGSAGGVLEEIDYLDDTNASENEPLAALRSLSTKVRSPRFRLVLVSRVSRLITIANLKSFLFFLVPSFLQNLISSTPSKTAPHGGVAALDGLRGIACLLVVHCHFMGPYRGSEATNFFHQWPILNLLDDGRGQVSVFFVISGYVLSYKPLKSIRAYDLDLAYKSLTSSTLRRAFRLFLPPIAINFIWALLAYSGFFTNTYDLYNARKPYLRLWASPPYKFDSFSTQMWNAVLDAYRLADSIIAWGTPKFGHLYHDRNQWTLPLEFQCSMALFAVLLASTRLRTVSRLFIFLVLITYAAWSVRNDVLSFWAGMFVAELDLIAKYRKSSKAASRPLLGSPLTTSTHATGLLGRQRLRGFLSQAPYVVSLIFGWYLLSCPGTDKPIIHFIGTYLFPSFVPKYDIALREIGAAFVVWSAVNFDIFNRFLSIPPVQYLGKISFALYLVHGNIIKSVGFSILPWSFQFVTGGLPEKQIKLEAMTSSQMVVLWLIGFVCCFPVAIWAADLFWRAVDMPCVTFARWIEEKLNVSNWEQAKDDYKRREAMKGSVPVRV